jgi:hypothetical protein
VAIVIRVAWNNKSWKASCDTPGKDPFCWYCFRGVLQIEQPKKDDFICTGDCWESRLCKEFKWGCTAKGKVYGSDAYPGVSAFFVFKQPDDNYTVWGRTSVSAVDTQPMKSTYKYEDGYAFIHFQPFEPLPPEKWVKNLSDVELVGKRWLQGRHRYIDNDQAVYLDQLIDGQVRVKSIKTIFDKVNFNNTDEVALGTSIAPSIYKKLEEIASNEGRGINELVREAIAKWLKTK